MTGTTASPGWPGDPTAAPPAEDETETVDEESSESEPKHKRGRPKKSE